MDEEVFPNAQVKELITRYYVPVRIETEKDTSLVTQYSIPGLPTILILDKDGKELQRLIGYTDTETFTGVLKDAAGVK